MQHGNNTGWGNLHVHLHVHVHVYAKSGLLSDIINTSDYSARTVSDYFGFASCCMVCCGTV